MAGRLLGSHLMPGGVPELPAAAAAVVAHAAGDLRIEDVPVSAPAPDEAVVEVAFGGICGSDLHYWMHGAAGESVLRQPMILGHEIVGTVLIAAADGSGPGSGTAVAVHPATPGPGAARYPEDRPNLSPGCTYLGSAARFPHISLQQAKNFTESILKGDPDEGGIIKQAIKGMADSILPHHDGS
jgi:L-iditol 2-dehydrogenase/L-idonate 5-dehydrogenase